MPTNTYLTGCIGEIIGFYRSLTDEEINFTYSQIFDEKVGNYRLNCFPTDTYLRKKGKSPVSIGKVQQRHTMRPARLCSYLHSQKTITIFRILYNVNIITDHKVVWQRASDVTQPVE